MRPSPSPESHQAFIDNYDHANQRTLAGWFIQRGHRLLERTLPRNVPHARVLEVGAGTGHHVNHLDRPYQAYFMTDHDERMLGIAKSKFETAVASGRLRLERQDAARLTYPDSSFDRVIATHVLEHIPRPISALEEWHRIVRPGGVISILLPCDPGLLWRIGRTLGPRRTAERAGVAYDYLMAVEHVNAIFNLVAVIRYHFERIHEAWYPARIPSPDLNLFYLCHIVRPL